MRKLCLLSLTFAIAIALSGCTMPGKSSPQTKNVSAKDNQFDPNALSLNEDDKIMVKNDGENLHSVTIHKVGDAVTVTKKDSDIAKGTSTDYTFDEGGTYHVYCKYHSGGTAGHFDTGMVLTVTVKQA